MDNFKVGDSVEFTAPAWCRVLFPTGKSASIRVANEQTGEVCDRTEYECLPGDLPVLTYDTAEERNYVVSVREGLLAKYRLEHDSRTGDPVFKHYRGMSVELDPTDAG